MEIKLAQNIRMYLLLDDSLFFPTIGYNFVSVGCSRGELGSVVVFDLKNLKLIDHSDVGIHAGGIAFWKIKSLIIHLTYNAK